jgi:hypothetical protein
MRRSLALAALLLLALPAHADATGFLTTVAPGDADMNLELHTSRVTVGYIDGNGNSRPDTVPDEMLYLDLDASGSVTYGDLRLSAFDTYAPGTVVDITNRDAGRGLTPLPNAWFAQGGGAWVLDVDNSGSVTAGDVAFAAAPAKVMPGDSRVGQGLTRPSGTPTNSYGWTSQGARDVAKTFYIDLDGFSTGGGRTSPGDLRVSPLGLAPDNAPSRAEFEQAQKAAAAQPPTAAPAAGISPSAWRTLDWFLVGLGILNVVGLAAIARQVNHLRGPPRNPFK